MEEWWSFFGASGTLGYGRRDGVVRFTCRLGIFRARVFGYGGIETSDVLGGFSLANPHLADLFCGICLPSASREHVR